MVKKLNNMKTQQSKNIEVEEIGISVPSSSWEGKIISVFPKAINILHPKGFLVSLIKEPPQMSSLSILAPKYFLGGRKNFKRLEAGTRAIFSERKLVIDCFSFELIEGRTWDGTLSLDNVIGFNFRKIPLFIEILLLIGKPEGFLGLLRPMERMNQFLKKCLSILEKVKVSNLQDNGIRLSGLSPLVGLGIGFTPSGDDFLTGVLLGERVLSLLLMSKMEEVKKEMGKSCYLHIEKKEVFNSLDKTNFAGRTLLCQALIGQFPSYLLKLTRSIAKSSNLNEMMAGLLEATRHGETSGTDASVGFFWFLNYFKEMGFCKNN